MHSGFVEQKGSEDVWFRWFLEERVVWLLVFKISSIWAGSRKAYLDLCVSLPSRAYLVMTRDEQHLQEGFVAAFNQC